MFVIDHILACISFYKICQVINYYYGSFSAFSFVTRLNYMCNWYRMSIIYVLIYIKLYAFSNFSPLWLSSLSILSQWVDCLKSSSLSMRGTTRWKFSQGSWKLTAQKWKVQVGPISSLSSFSLFSLSFSRLSWWYFKRYLHVVP